MRVGSGACSDNEIAVDYDLVFSKLVMLSDSCGLFGKEACALWEHDEDPLCKGRCSDTCKNDKICFSGGFSRQSTMCSTGFSRQTTMCEYGESGSALSTCSDFSDGPLSDDTDIYDGADSEEGDERMFLFDEEVDDSCDIAAKGDDGAAWTTQKEDRQPSVADAHKHSLDDNSDAVCTSTSTGHQRQIGRCGNNRGLHCLHDAEEDQRRTFFFDEEVGNSCDPDAEGGGSDVEEEDPGLADIFFFGD